MQRFLTEPLLQPPADLLRKSPDALRLRGRAAEGLADSGDRGELKKVAQEFESLFVAYLLKVMRESIEEAGLTEGGFGKGIYTDLFDQEFSRGIAQHGALGIADLLMKRLAAQAPEIAVEDGIQEPAASPPPHSPGAELESDIPDFRLPVKGPISSRFGMRSDPFTHLPRFHKGLDLAAPAGMEVRAAMAGEVVFSGYKPGYGNLVVLQHPGGLQTRYAHLGSTGVKKGDSIGGEQVLGSVGNTGHSTGPHLHVEVIRWGERVNPAESLGD